MMGNTPNFSAKVARLLQIKPPKLITIRAWIRKTDIQTLLAYLCIVFLATAELLFFVLNDAAPKAWIATLTICASLSGFAAWIIDHKDFISRTWKHSATKAAIALATFWISIYSLNFADSLIVQFTLQAPSQFARAQTALASAIAPIFWLTGFYAALTFIYFLQIFHMIRLGLLQNKPLLRSRPYRIVGVVFSIPKTNPQPLSPALETGKLIGLALMILVVMRLLFRLFSSDELMEPAFRSLFISSSFYTNRGACPHLPKSAEISFLKDGRALYVDDENALSVKLSDCR